MTAPLSTAVLVRLAQAYAKTHPGEDAEQSVRRAKTLIASLHAVGLDVVMSSWIDQPGQVTSAADPWDAFVQGMNSIYEQNKDRQPWRP